MAFALAGPAYAGNGHGNRNGPPSGSGNICPPSNHGVPAGTNDCYHNGDGGGNCGQNQSNNTGHGAGNGGNDNGYGHKPGCGGPTPPCPSGSHSDQGHCVPPPDCHKDYSCPVQKGTIVVCKALVPSTDYGRFDLKVDSTVVKYSAGNGDCGSGQFNTGMHTVSESGASGTNLGNYYSSVDCVSTYQHQDPPGTSIYVNLHSGETITCKFTNKRKPVLPPCGHEHQCPPPPCGGMDHPCPPPPGCAPGETGTPPHCMPPCPEGTTPMMQNGVQVCMKPGPTTVVTTPCPCKCPPAKPGHKPKPKPKCPKVKKSQIHVSFTPPGIKTGNLHVNVSVPKSWHVTQATLKICTPRSGIGKAKSCKSSKSTYVKKLVIKLKNGKGHLVLRLSRTSLWGKWLYGNHRMEFSFRVRASSNSKPCKKVKLSKPFFNFDPPFGTTVKNGHVVRVAVSSRSSWSRAHDFRLAL
jgi:hypothetical protein